MTPRRDRPQRAVVHFRGITYEMDILACERALLQRQVGGEFLTMDALAEAVGVSRSTVSRFLSGRSLSLKVTLAILGRLRLRFEDVFRPYRPDAASQ